MNPYQQPIAIGSPSSAVAANKLIRNTYTLLAMTLLCSAATAGASIAFNLPYPGMLITLVGYFGLLFLTYRLRNSVWGLLSIFALSNYPPQGTFSASKAAAHSLSQCLRAEMRHSGVRVVNVYPGPVDDEWNQLILPPKLSPTALASSIVKALQDGIEDVYPGDVAQDWLARWRDNPKALERELAG